MRGLYSYCGPCFVLVGYFFRGIVFWGNCWFLYFLFLSVVNVKTIFTTRVLFCWWEVRHWVEINNGDSAYRFNCLFRSCYVVCDVVNVFSPYGEAVVFC